MYEGVVKVLININLKLKTKKSEEYCNYGWFLQEARNKSQLNAKKSMPFGICNKKRRRKKKIKDRFVYVEKTHNLKTLKARKKNEQKC